MAAVSALRASVGTVVKGCCWLVSGAVVAMVEATAAEGAAGGMVVVGAAVVVGATC